ncbi:MAG TPA: ParB N-terminal domain-containing protein [Pirellulales bacterium]|nr:ParB N-terminal domain-containing protein [Pirellulales bacterium]
MSETCDLVVLALDHIRLDGGTQIREAIDEDVVGDYAALMDNQVYLPPLWVFHDGENYWLVDGFHRWHALKKNRRTEALCQVRSGSHRDALLAAVRANHTHGLRRTNADKRRAVEILLADADWTTKGLRWIAEMAGVSHQFVSSIRCQVSTVDTSQKGGLAGPAVIQGRDGKFYPQRAANRQQTGHTDAAVDRVEAALQSASAFDVCLARLNDAARLGEKLARGPGGGYFAPQLELYQDQLKRTEQLLDDAKPGARCDQCGGAGCAACRELGYVCAAPRARIQSSVAAIAG